MGTEERERTTVARNRIGEAYTRDPLEGYMRQPHEPDCACPVCTGLGSLQRPRFFAGQLLTERELTTAQDYVRAKSRLHNRYLHGPGVVCGLEVSCHPECRGWVVVRPGYAIDPCGEDVVVPCEEEIDVVARIRDCAERERRRAVRADCDPIGGRYDVRDERCADSDGIWCITLEYEERETAVTMPLRRTRHRAATARDCGCGCGGHGDCEKANGNGNAHPATEPSRGPGIDPQCEPTRVVESYRLDVVRGPASGKGARTVMLQHAARAQTVLTEAVGAEMTPEGGEAVRELLTLDTSEVGGAQFDEEVLATGMNGLSAAAARLWRQDPLRVRCGPRDVAGGSNYTKQNLGSVEAKMKARELSQATIGQISNYASEYLCAALLPPCAPDPCDDRLVLACLRVEGKDVVEICNLSRRRFAGAFPTVFHWMEIVGLLPRAERLVAAVCCGGERDEPAPKPSKPSQPIPPPPQYGYTTASYAMTAGTGDPITGLEPIAVALQPNRVVEMLPGPGEPIEPLVGEPVGAVEKAVERAGANVIVREVASAAEIPPDAVLSAPARAVEGGTVEVYALRSDTPSGRTVLATRAIGEAQAKAASAEPTLAELKDEIADLRKEMRKLRRKGGP